MKHALTILIFIITTQFVGSQNSILWRVSDTVNNKTSFIVGTFHQIGNSFVDSIPEIKNHLKNSDLALFESLDNADDTREVINKRQRSNDIEKNLKKDDFTKLKEITRNWKVDLYKLKPIEIRWKLQQEHPKIVCKTVKQSDKFDHFDNYLQHLAKENNVELLGLETNQLDILEREFENSNWKKERKNISAWIHKINTDKTNVKNCAYANKYMNFDLDYEFQKECESNYIILDRNNEWMKKIPNLLSTQNIFIAVGIDHLKWKCGILKQLENQGFEITPIEIKREIKPK
ncbi:MAG: TraB/GumN family protein [Xanthomarina sp.]